MNGIRRYVTNLIVVSIFFHFYLMLWHSRGVHANITNRHANATKCIYTLPRLFIRFAVWLTSEANVHVRGKIFHLSTSTTILSPTFELIASTCIICYNFESTRRLWYFFTFVKGITLKSHDGRIGQSLVPTTCKFPRAGHRMGINSRSR